MTHHTSCTSPYLAYWLFLTAIVSAATAEVVFRLLNEEHQLQGPVRGVPIEAEHTYLALGAHLHLHTCVLGEYQMFVLYQPSAHLCLHTVAALRIESLGVCSEGEKTQKALRLFGPFSPRCGSIFCKATVHDWPVAQTCQAPCDPGRDLYLESCCTILLDVTL